MALYKFIQPILFTTGINQDVSDKIGVDLLKAENVVMTKQGRLDTRKGFDPVASTIGITGEAIKNGEMITQYNNELLLFTSDTLYTYAQDNWVEKNKKITITNTTDSLNRSTSNIAFHKYARSAEGIELLVYSDNMGVVDYDVIRDGAKLVYRKPLGTNIDNLEVVFKSGYFVFVYVQNAKLMTCNVLYTNPSIISTPVEILDGVLPFIQVVNYSSKWITVFGVNADENLVAVYIDKDGTPAEASDRLPPLTVFDTISVTGFLSIFAATLTYPIYNILTNSTVTTTDCYQVTHNFVASDTHVLHDTAVSDIATGIDLGNNQLEIYTSKGTDIFKTLGDYTGGVFTFGLPLELCKSVSLVSEPFIFKGSPFIITAHTSLFQSSYFIIDCKTGLPEGRIDYLTGGGSTTYLYKVFSNNETYTVTAKTRTKIEAQGSNYAIHYGIDKHVFDFNSPRAYQTLQFANTLHIGGSIPHIYDGSNYVEHGFLLFPEQIECSVVAKYVSYIEYGNVGVADMNDIHDDDGEMLLVPYLNGSGVYGDVFPLHADVYYRWYDYEDTLVSTNRILQVYDKVGQEITVKCRMFIKDDLDALNEVAVHTISFTIAKNDEATQKQYLEGDKLTGGSIYFYQACYSWTDTQGNLHRSAPTVSPIAVAVPDGYDSVNVTVPTLRLTKKADINIEIYRSEPRGGNVHLIKTLPNNTAVDSITFLDDSSDDYILQKEPLYTTGGVLENAPPHSCKYIALHQDRLFLAGLRDSRSIQYSQINSTGYPSEFSDYFVMPLPVKQEITAMYSLGDVLYIFTPDSIGALLGQGGDTLGLGGNYRFEYVSRDVGCITFNSIVETSNGVYFQSKKGIYVLRRGGQVEFIGKNVKDYRVELVTASYLVGGEAELRFYTASGNTLVFNEMYNIWTVFTNTPTLSAVLYNGVGFRLSSDGSNIFKDADSFSDAGNVIPMAVRTNWFASATLQGLQRIYRINVVGNKLDYHSVRISLYYDHSNSVSEVFLFDANSAVRWGGVSWEDDIFSGLDDNAYTYTIRPRNQKCSTFSLEVELVSEENQPTEGFSLNYIVIEAGKGNGISKISTRAIPSHKS